MKGLKVILFPILIIGMVVISAFFEVLSVLWIYVGKPAIHLVMVLGLYAWALVQVPFLVFSSLTPNERESFAWVARRRRAGQRFRWNGTRFWLPVVVRGRILGTITLVNQRPETIGHKAEWVEYTRRTVTVHGFLTQWFIPRVHMDSSLFLVEPHGCRSGENVVVIYDQVGLRHLVLDSGVRQPQASKVQSAFRHNRAPNYEDDMDDDDADEGDTDEDGGNEGDGGGPTRRGS